MKLQHVNNFFKTLCQKISRIFKKRNKVSPVVIRFEQNPYEML